MPPEVSWHPQLTGDNSWTFFSYTFQEAFHSHSGAKQEAELKFIIPAQIAQQASQTSDLAILDVCYGLGYNSAAALTAAWRANPNCRIHLLALELDLTVPQGAIQLGVLADYPAPVVEALAALATEQRVQSSCLDAQLLIGDARQTAQTLPADFQADAIFLDPFSGPKCPQLWTVEFLRLLAGHLRGYLVTYSCAGAVRSALLAAGLQIASTPSVGRKNPGTIASRHPLPPLSAVEKDHLNTRAAIPYRDPNFTDDPDTIRDRRRTEQANSPLLSTSQWKKRRHTGYEADSKFK